MTITVSDDSSEDETVNVTSESADKNNKIY